jgi:Zn-dependent membrane protease YugP
MFLWDSTIIILIPAIILGIIAQARVSSAFKRWSQVPARSGYSGAQIAQYLLRQGTVQLGEKGAVLGTVGIRAANGFLSDHYNPANETLNLSPEVYEGRSIAALAIAAHETGHAYQHATGYAALALRSLLVPAAQAGQLCWLLFIIGLFARTPLLQNVAIWIFAGATLFTFATLPVEFNASSRAKVMLQQSGLVAAEEMPGVNAVLNAAALTYVAAALMAAMQLLRMILLRRD